MRIIGIDPGTGILGFGVIDAVRGRVKLVTAGVVTTPAHTPLPERLGEIYHSLTEIIAETKPQHMAIEKLFFTKNISAGNGAIAIRTNRSAEARRLRRCAGCGADARFYAARTRGIMKQWIVYY